METNIQNKRIVQQLINGDISYTVYLSLLAVVYIWHFTALIFKVYCLNRRYNDTTVNRPLSRGNSMKNCTLNAKQAQGRPGAGRKRSSIAYPLIALPVYLCSLLPFTVLYTFARLIYFLFFRLLKYRYAIVFQNLSRSFPQMSYREIDAVACRFYRHLSEILVEVVKLMSISESEFKTRLHLRNPELLEYYHRQNRPVIAMMGHCGNWEALSILPRYFASQVYAVYRPLSNKGMNRLLLYIRSRFGMKLLSMSQAPRYMLQHKEESALYLFIADQSPDPDARCRVEFMHQSTLMFNGAEKLARATGAVVVYLEVNRASKKHWVVGFSLVAEDPAAMPAHEITRRYAHKLQQTIYKAPDQWLWTHKRWKHKVHMETENQHTVATPGSTY